MKTSIAMVVGAVPMLGPGSAAAQSRGMMGGGYGGYGSGMWDAGWMGGYGGMLGPFLLSVAVAGLVAWIVARKCK